MRIWLVMLLGGILGGLPGAAAAQPAEPTRTDVRYLIPFTPSGLSPALTVTADERGTCLAGSLADAGRPDAWRCRAGNAILDPCFVNIFTPETEPARLACFPSPFSPEIVLLTLTEPLPADLANRPPPDPNVVISPDALPWALELANGEQCTVATGATIGLVGLRLNYFCVGKGAIFGAPDRRQSVWTVVYWPDGAAATSTVAVTTAWS